MSHLIEIQKIICSYILQVEYKNEIEVNTELLMFRIWSSFLDFLCKKGQSSDKKKRRDREDEWRKVKMRKGRVTEIEEKERSAFEQFSLYPSLKNLKARIFQKAHFNIRRRLKSGRFRN
ncbi:hypothetical protein RUM44_005861 [Polyplax serrata]|uniref:Uncharacterized protein n=1 Tax=Polyplax serrata TaxID=468196 RepID=A0ABR1AYV8_POLSC